MPSFNQMYSLHSGGKKKSLWKLLQAHRDSVSRTFKETKKKSLKNKN